MRAIFRSSTVRCPKKMVGRAGKKPRDPWGVDEASPPLGPLLAQRTATSKSYDDRIFVQEEPRRPSLKPRTAALLLPQLVHAAFICDAQPFRGVGAHQGVAPWQRRRTSKRNRKACELYLEHRDFDRSNSKAVGHGSNRRLCVVAPDVPLSWAASCGLSKPGSEASRMALHAQFDQGRIAPARGRSSVIVTAPALRQASAKAATPHSLRSKSGNLAMFAHLSANEAAPLVALATSQGSQRSVALHSKIYDSFAMSPRFTNVG